MFDVIAEVEREVVGEVEGMWCGRFTIGFVVDCAYVKVGIPLV